MTEHVDWNEICSQVDEVCGKVFLVAYDVLRDVNKFGIEGLLDAPKPNAEDKLLRVKLLESIFSVLIDEFERRDEFELVFKLLNAKEQILRLERLINAVKRNDFEECNRLVRLLTTQVQL